MEEKVAKFRFNEYRFIESHFFINVPENGKTGPVSVEVNRESLVSDSSNSFKLIMSVRIKDDDGIINISVKVEGLFVFDSDLEDNQKNNFFDFNAPAILYPYVRAYVSALTSLSGFNPLILPTINFAARKKNS